VGRRSMGWGAGSVRFFNAPGPKTSVVGGGSFRSNAECEVFFFSGNRTIYFRPTLLFLSAGQMAEIDGIFRSAQRKHAPPENTSIQSRQFANGKRESRVVDWCGSLGNRGKENHGNAESRFSRCARENSPGRNKPTTEHGNLRPELARESKRSSAQHSGNWHTVIGNRKRRSLVAWVIVATSSTGSWVIFDAGFYPWWGDGPYGRFRMITTATDMATMITHTAYDSTYSDGGRFYGVSILRRDNGLCRAIWPKPRDGRRRVGHKKRLAREGYFIAEQVRWACFGTRDSRCACAVSKAITAAARKRVR